jgi:hypothetical protein
VMLRHAGIQYLKLKRKVKRLGTSQTSLCVGCVTNRPQRWLSARGTDNSSSKIQRRALSIRSRLVKRTHHGYEAASLDCN